MIALYTDTAFNYNIHTQHCYTYIQVYVCIGIILYLHTYITYHITQPTHTHGGIHVCMFNDRLLRLLVRVTRVTRLLGLLGLPVQIDSRPLQYQEIPF